MAPEERWLPLFPLSTVLFPNAPLPIQIFEDRYKLMLRHCLDSDSRFGVVLIKSGSEVGEPATPYSTGTVAQIAQVNPIQGERFFALVTGERRFRIKEVTQLRPYMAARVEVLEDTGETWLPPTELQAVRDAATRYARLLLGLRGAWTREVAMPSDPARLSYFIGTLLQIGVAEKQVLLEEASAARRLEAELDLLRRESEALRKRVVQELAYRRFSRQ